MLELIKDFFVGAWWKILVLIAVIVFIFTVYKYKKFISSQWNMLKKHTNIIDWMPWVINIIGLLVFGSMMLSIGLILPETQTTLDGILLFLSGVIVWFSIYTAIGIRIVKENHFMVIERFGAYHRTIATLTKNRESGLTVLCFPGLIDQIAKEGDYLQHLLRLYTRPEGGNHAIDFTDGSATVVIQVRWQFDPDKEDPKLPESERASFKATYDTDDPERHMEEIIDSAARTLLQNKTIDEASKNLTGLGKEVAENDLVKYGLKKMGIKLDGERGVLFTDIILSPEVIKLRQQKMEGEKDAERATAQATGMAESIQKILKSANGSDVDPKKHLTFQDAVAIYQNQLFLSALPETKANITLIAPGTEAIMKTMDIGKKGVVS